MEMNAVNGFLVGIAIAFMIIATAIASCDVGRIEVYSQCKGVGILLIKEKKYECKEIKTP